MANLQSAIDFSVLKRSALADPIISAIVPVYNQCESGFLAPCLESLLDQSLNNIEIICIDDASTDNSLEVLLDFASKNPTMTVVEMKYNSRQGTARNRGIDLAKGEYIAFIDSDDVISLNFFEALYEVAAQTNCDAVESAFQCINDKGIKYGKIFQPHETTHSHLDRSAKEHLLLEHGMIWSYLFKRKIFNDKRLRFPERVQYEDTAILPRILLSIASIAGAPNAIYYYRQSSTSTIGKTSHDLRAISDRLKAADAILDNALEDGSYSEFKEALDYGYLQFYYLNTINFLLLADHQTRQAFNAKSLNNHLMQRIPYIRKNHYVKNLPTLRSLITIVAIKLPSLYFKTARMAALIKRIIATVKC